MIGLKKKKEKKVYEPNYFFIEKQSWGYNEDYGDILGPQSSFFTPSWLQVQIVDNIVGSYLSNNL